MDPCNFSLYTLVAGSHTYTLVGRDPFFSSTYELQKSALRFTIRLSAIATNHTGRE